VSPPGAVSPIGWIKREVGKIPPVAKSRGPELKCISIRRTRNVDLGWVNMRAYNFFVSGPTFTKFSSTRKWSLLITPFTVWRYLNTFQRYSRSKLKVVLVRTEFWTFFTLQIFNGVVPPKVVPVLSPPPKGTPHGSLLELLPLHPEL